MTKMRERKGNATKETDKRNREGVQNDRLIEKRNGIGSETAARTCAPHHRLHCRTALSAFVLVSILAMVYKMMYVAVSKPVPMQVFVDDARKKRMRVLLEI